MAKNVTINLFEVSRSKETPPLSETLQAFASLSLENRARSDVRLDQITKQPADLVLPHDTWHLDFSKARDIGPGKMAKDKRVDDIGLVAGELFGEETAAIYLPKKKWLLVLHNQYGVGPSRMATYFNALDPGNTQNPLMYSISPKIDQAALNKMKAMKQFAEVEIMASVGAFDEKEHVGESVLEAANEIKAHRVHLRFIANEKHKKGATLGLGAVKGFVDSLLQKGDDIHKLKVKCAEKEVDAQDRIIDLIEHKIRQQYPARELLVENHRYTYDSKINLLRRACRGWLDSIG